MNMVALYISRPGMAYSVLQRGYVDSLRAAGWKVLITDLQTKLGCRQLIESHNINLIFTHSRYGIRQLPIDTINNRNISVVVNILPFNGRDGAHTDEAAILSKIKFVVAHTQLETDVWSDHLKGWFNTSFPLIHSPLAGNIITALPTDCSSLTDVVLVANLRHRLVVMKKLIIPLFKQLDILDYSYQIFGDELWTETGLNYNGPLSTDKLAQVYATAKVCPNIHTQQQVEEKTSINERLFTIPLCGGYQIVNSPLATTYLGKHITVASRTSDFIVHTINAIENADHRREQIRGAMEHIAHNHTYFNRLFSIFCSLGKSDWADSIKKTGYDLAIKHCWEMRARLSAEERGVPWAKSSV